MENSFTSRAAQLVTESRAELIAIADWWIAHSQDSINGGFYGEITADNLPVATASKGVILNARILWFFSETAYLLKTPEYRQAADRAYDYLQECFVDKEFGGVYWELDAQGQVINNKKQIYAQAFSIYALSAYYKLTNNIDALNLALVLFDLIEHYGNDKKHQGYLEAFTREWKPIQDLRLSERDLNFPKSQNTHLHILEAYTALCEINREQRIEQALRYNIDMFDRYMIDRGTYHLRMFMNLQWQDYSPGFTYGHDIEAAWLIGRGLEVLGDKSIEEKLLPDLLNVAEVNWLSARTEDGHIKDSFDFATQTENADAVWWVQAEAMVGYLYAWRWSQDKKYFDAVEKIWEFIKGFQMDKENGEWFWLSKNDDQSRQPIYKVGFWKCPYHNGRAMMEVERLLK